MKILSASQIRQLDAYTIKNEPIASIDLMERAAEAFCGWYIDNFDTEQIVRILCGPGNNGGDGLAIGRLLFNRGYKVEIDIVNPLDTFSADATLNLKRLPANIPKRIIREVKDIPLNYSSEIIIDALFGSGLNRPLDGIYADLVSIVNNWDADIISIDIPTGIFCDLINHSHFKIKAKFTISFQVPKQAFFLKENEDFLGQWILLDIGLSDKGLMEAQTNQYFIDRQDANKMIRPRGRYDHKGIFGHSCIMGGSKGKIGAAVLSGSAALRSGTGLLTLYVPQIGYQIVQTALPEAMCLTDIGENYLVDIPDTEKFDAIAIGPGMDQNDESLSSIESLFERYRKPIVIDADALNLLAKHEHLLKNIPENSILTPHPGEFRRLAGQWEDDLEKVSLQRVFSKNYKCIVVLKGAYTSISDPEGNTYYNSTGNPGMATAGSGDALTGIITAQLAKGYNALDAAIFGVYIHGLAGDLALNIQNEESLIAGDIISHLGEAFNDLG